MNHVSAIAMIQRVIAGAATAREAVDVGRHLNECETCAECAQEILGLRNAVACLDAAFTEEMDAEPFLDRDADVRSSLSLSLRRASCSYAVPLGLVAAGAMLFVILFPLAPRERVGSVSSTRKADSPRPATVISHPKKADSRLRPEWIAMLAEVHESGRLPLPAELMEFAQDDVYRGDSSEMSAHSVSPSATAVDNTRPQFTWTPTKGARYVVTVCRDHTIVARSRTLSNARWTPDEPLRRGHVYRWQVEVSGAGEPVILPSPPSPAAVFRIIAGQEHEELESATREFGDHDLLLGVLFARAGMIEPAREKLAAWKRNGADPAAERLLQQLPASKVEP